ncbi:MAG: hypothetical protein LBV29_03080 [Azoarcus sp.]|jgi:hypothetical protein|nr:hypothetical protein [Azoarcus sp.]
MMFKQYQNKRVTVEAWHFDGTCSAAIEFVHANQKGTYFKYDGQDNVSLYFYTRAGVVVANPGDYIIRDAQGVLCSCKPAIFAETYSAIDLGTISFTANLAQAVYEGRKTKTRRKLGTQPDEGGLSFSPVFGEWIDATRLYAKPYFVGNQLRVLINNDTDGRFPQETNIVIEITNVRAERLHAITDDEIIAEGAYKFPSDSGGWKFGRGEQEYDTPREAYRALWGSIYGKDSWDENPWVWVITFQRT